MQFSDAIRAIKERLSLADIARRYVELRQNGPRLIAPCPFHQETKPSFYISDDRGTFYCFGCQASGDLIEFYSRINGLDFRETVTQLAEEAGISIDEEPSPGFGKTALRTDRQAMLDMHNAAANHFMANLGAPPGGECGEYITRRGLARETVERFGLGWAARDWHSLEHCLKRLGYNLELACECGLLAQSARGGLYDRFRGRLMFPIRNLSNQVIAFGGRIICDEDEAKYINSADTPIYGKKEHLYGLPQARRAISAKGFALLTEGYMDVLTLHEFGFANSVGALGTALTEEQIRRLSGFTSRVGLLFDGDGPGRKAALRACGMFLSRGLDCTVILQPDGEDIDSLLRTAGPETFSKLLESAPDGLAYCISCLEELAPREAIDWARSFLAGVQIPELTSRYATHIARRLGISESALRESLREKPAGNRRQPPPEAEHRDLCARDTQIIMLLARYPERLEDIRELGADLALTTERARNVWALVELHGPEQVHYHLDERQKRFWNSQRGPEAAPRDSFETELNCLKECLDRFYAQSQAASLKAAYARPGNAADSDLAFLQAIRDTMRKDNEQS